MLPKISQNRMVLALAAVGLVVFDRLQTDWLAAPGAAGSFALVLLGYALGKDDKGGDS